MSLTNTLKRAVWSFSLVYSLALPAKALAAIYSFSPSYTATNRAFSFHLLSDQFGSCTTYSGLISSIMGDTLSLSFAPTTPTGCTNINSQSYYGPTFSIQGLQAGLYKVRVHILGKVICLACPPSPGDDAGTFLVADSVNNTKKVGWFLKETTVKMGNDPYPMQLLNYAYQSCAQFLNKSMKIENGGIYTSFFLRLPPCVDTSSQPPPLIGPTFELTPPLKPGAYPVYATELMACEVATVGPICVVKRLAPVAVDTLFVMASTQIRTPRNGDQPLEARQSPSAAFRNGSLVISLPQDARLASNSLSTWRAKLFTESGRVLKTYHFESRLSETVNLDAGMHMERGVYLLRLQAPSRKSFTMLLAVE